MKVEIIAIGDELLIGQTVNTNASWMGEVLSLNGATVEYSGVIKDEENAILDAVDRAMSRVDVVLMTGGLGPTKDDITKEVLCNYFDTTLAINERVLQKIRDFFSARGREVLDVNVQQAALPVAAKILENDLGTASGMWFEKEGKILISMPGVPYEMKHLMLDRVVPLLKERFKMNSIYHQTIQLQGIGESFLAERIEHIENEIRSKGIGLAYLPSPGLVRLRLTSEKTEQRKKEIENYIQQITKLLPQYVFSRGEVQLSEVLGNELVRKNATVGCVESCTAGALSSEIVSVPGSSRYFQGAIVSYSNELKANFVGVEKDLLINFGAVSKEVVCSMAENGKRLLNVDYCLSISGIAGPDGGTEQKPVGTVWIGLATPNEVKAKCFKFGDQRDRNIRMSVLSAMNLLRCELLEINF